MLTCRPAQACKTLVLTADKSLIGQHSHSGDGNGEGQRKSKLANPDIKLQTDLQGYPILPSWDLIKDANLIHKKYLIGRYLTEMYSELQKCPNVWYIFILLKITYQL